VYICRYVGGESQQRVNMILIIVVIDLSVAVCDGFLLAELLE